MVYGLIHLKLGLAYFPNVDNEYMCKFPLLYYFTLISAT